MQIWFNRGDKQHCLKRKQEDFTIGHYMRGTPRALNMLELTSSFKRIYIRRGFNRMSKRSIVRSSFTTFSDRCFAENKKSFCYCSQCLNRFQV